MFEYVLFESSHVYSIAYIKMYVGTILLTKYFEQMPRGKKAQQFSFRLLIMVTCHMSRGLVSRGVSRGNVRPLMTEQILRQSREAESALADALVSDPLDFCLPISTVLIKLA